jgi:alanine dehydrogenase
VDPKLTDKLIENHITAIAYETVAKDGGLPLLAPMSQVAGVLACQYGAHYLQKKHGGIGVSLGHIDGADHALTVIVGAGFVGRTAAVTAGGMGGDVVLLDISPQAIERAEKEIHACLGPKLSRNVTAQVSSQKILEQWVKKADLLIGAVLIPGAKAPQVVSEKMIHSMKHGAVIVDVAIDQGGCIWGTQPTSHRHPIYDLDGKIYCCIPNMPGQVAHQSTQALTSATLPYILEIAEAGPTVAFKKNVNLRKGLNTFGGKITYESVAHDLKLEHLYVPPEKLLSIGADRAQRSLRKKGRVLQKKFIKRA